MPQKGFVKVDTIVFSYLFRYLMYIEGISMFRMFLQVSLRVSLFPQWSLKVSHVHRRYIKVYLMVVAEGILQGIPLLLKVSFKVSFKVSQVSFEVSLEVFPMCTHTPWYIHLHPEIYHGGITRGMCNGEADENTEERKVRESSARGVRVASRTCNFTS